MNFGKIGFWLHIWGFYVVTNFRKKKSELLLVDPNKGCSYSGGITRTPAFVWVGLGCIWCTVASIPDQCVMQGGFFRKNWYNRALLIKKSGFWVCLNTRCGSNRDVVQLSDFKSSKPMSQISLTHVYIIIIFIKKTIFRQYGLIFDAKFKSSFALLKCLALVNLQNTANSLKSIIFFW